MSALALKRWRLKLDSRTPGEDQLDVLTGEPPAVWTGNALNIEFGIFNVDDTVATDFTAYTSIVCELWQSQTRNALLAPQKIIAPNTLTSISKPNWDNGSAQHGTFQFSTEEMSLGFHREDRYGWLVICAIRSTGARVTLGAGPIWIVHDGALGGGTPPAPIALYYTKAEIDAMFDELCAGGGSTPPDEIVFYVSNGIAVFDSGGVLHTFEVVDIGSAVGDNGQFVVAAGTFKFVYNGRQYATEVVACSTPPGLGEGEITVISGVFYIVLSGQCYSRYSVPL